jgi:hypothetical protein
MLIAIGSALSGSVYAANAPLVTCKSVDGKNLTLCVNQERWSDTESQYVVYYAVGDTCHAPDSGTTHMIQYIHNDIKTVNADSIVLKQRSSILGLFCRQKAIFKLDRQKGQGSLDVNQKGCGLGGILSDGNGPTPAPFKISSELRCE